MPHKNTSAKTAVFIDAANLELSAKDLNFRIDYQKAPIITCKKPVFHNGRLITIFSKTAKQIIS